MGIAVMILGESGSGKSASLRNFEPEDVGIFNVASKPLPFKKQLPKMDKPTYKSIQDGLKKNSRKTYVIDDAQYLMAFEAMAKVYETGYGKFTEMAKHFYDLVQTAINDTTPDTVVYFLQHIERSEDGRIKAKTQGKMIDNQLTLEGMFSIVLLARTDGKRYWFATQSDGSSTCKSPMGMFPLEIDNDLKLVNDTIRDYYGFDKKEETK